MTTAEQATLREMCEVQARTVARIDGLERLIRENAAAVHFEQRNFEKAVLGRLDALLGGAPEHGSTTLPMALRSRSHTQLGHSRRTAPCGASSYVDAIVHHQSAQHDSRQSRNSDLSEADPTERMGRDKPECASSAPPTLSEPPLRSSQRRRAAARLVVTSDMDSPCTDRPEEAGCQQLLTRLSRREPRRASMMGVAKQPAAERHNGASRPSFGGSSSAGIGSCSSESRQASSGSALRDASPGSSKSSCLGAEASSLTREDRLRMLVTEDQNVDKLLMDIRCGELQAVQSSERERRWQATHPVSAALIITPDSPLKAWWDVLMLVCVRAYPRSSVRAYATHTTPTALPRARGLVCCGWHELPCLPSARATVVALLLCATPLSGSGLCHCHATRPRV